jgi:serine/threonine-protein kinase
MAAVLTREPDFAALPAATPPAIRALIKRCLERDPKRRLRDIGEARMVLDSPTTAAPARSAVVATPAPVRSLMWPIAAAVLAIALVAVSVLLWRSTNQLAASAVRTGITPPGNITFDLTIDPMVALSRDGSTMAFVGIDAGIRRLYVRRLSDFEPKMLAGTEGASSPFFSPSGEWIGFFSERLKKIPVGGGPVIDLADASDNRGAVWTDDDTIIYTPDASTPIYRISAAGGGSPVAVSKIDQEKQERTHRWPSLLPGGKEVLVTVGSAAHPDDYDDATIVAIRLDTGARRVVLERGRMAQYVSSGHLVFLRGQILYAVPFDLASGVAGTSPVPVIDGVSGDVTTGSANYAVSNSGTIAFVPGDPRGSERRIAWVDRQGKPTFIDVPPALYSDPHVSPDGKQIAVTMITGKSEMDIYLIDAARGGTPRRLTSDGNARTAIWSRDGKRLTYTVYDRARNVTKILSRPSDGIGEPTQIIEVPGVGFTESIAPDDTLTFSCNPSTAGQHADLYKLAPQPGSKPVKVVEGSKGDVYSGIVSPDGKWLAYTATEGGRYEVFVQSYAKGGSRTQVSTAGGFEPRWSSDSRALFFSQATTQMMVDVEPGDAFHPGKPRELFVGTMPPTSDSGQTYVVAPTRDGFLMLRPARDHAGPQEIRVIQNWFSELTKQTVK